MLRILLVISPATSFAPKSGEVEVKLLQIGFRLNGQKCDILGIDADDFETYDVYFIFSLNEDLNPFISAIPSGRHVYLYPQIEVYTPDTVIRVTKLLDSSPKSYVIARNSSEVTFYCSSFGNQRVYPVYGWFVEPFVWTNSCSSLHLESTNYGLSFVGHFDSSQFDDILNQCLKESHHLLVISSGIKTPVNPRRNLSLLPRVRYGSNTWYELLEHSRFFFEPHDRLTNSVLESVYFEKPIVSPHSKELNEYANCEIACSDLGTAIGQPSIPQRDFRKKLLNFRVEKVTYDILLHIKGQNAYC